MKEVSPWLRWLRLVAATSLLGLAACGGEEQMASVDRASAQAQGERQTQALVEPVQIPGNPELPTYVIVIKPFETSLSGVTSGTPTPMIPVMTSTPVIDPDKIGPGVSAQLITLLQGNVGNVEIVDYDFYQNNGEKVAAAISEFNTNPDGKKKSGPLLIRGTVTEFTEANNMSGEGESHGPNVALGLVPYVGGLLVLAKGTKSVHETRLTGMVGMDLQVVDPKNGRVISSFACEGTFTSIGMIVSRTAWGKTKTSIEYASSAIGQAQRVALNKAATKIHEAIVSKPLLAGR